MSRGEFEALLKDPEFERLYVVYEEAGFPQHLKPCLDRINPLEPFGSGTKRDLVTII